MSEPASEPAASSAGATTVDPPAAPPPPPQRSDGRTVGIATGFAALLAVAYLLLPTVGTDTSAQAAHADFAAAHGALPIDFGWYGGTHQFGYSLVSMWLMALLGVPLTGALAAVAATAAFTTLLLRTAVRRPLLGGLLAAGCFFGNLVSGRTTWAVGVAFGLWGLAALTLPIEPRPRRRLALVAAGAALASASSPVAGLFVGLAGTALMLGALRRDAGGWRGLARQLRSGRGRDGLVVAVAAAVPMVLVVGLFGDSGWMNISRDDMYAAVGASLLVALVVPMRYRAVKIGALLSAVGVLLAFAVHTPVGLNATRLATMFALPVIAATVTLRLRWLAPILALLVWWSPPLLTIDVRDAGNPTADRAYFAPLLDELRRRQPVGRVEVPPTRDYWEAAYVPPVAPLARGWLRQVDLVRNPEFFGDMTGADKLTAAKYRDWLRDNGVSYVAVPDAELSWVGWTEAELVREGLPYLTEVWRSAHWRLYRVDELTAVVAPPARVVTSDRTGVTFDVFKPGRVQVRVRHSRWLSVSGPACTLVRDGRWVALDVARPGRYRVTSSFFPSHDC